MADPTQTDEEAAIEEFGYLEVQRQKAQAEREQRDAAGQTTASDALTPAEGSAPVDPRTSGTGSPNPLADLSRDDLRTLAQTHDIPGRSEMNKDELVAALTPLET